MMNKLCIHHQQHIDHKTDLYKYIGDKYLHKYDGLCISNCLGRNMCGYWRIWKLEKQFYYNILQNIAIVTLLYLYAAYRGSEVVEMLNEFVMENSCIIVNTLDISIVKCEAVVCVGSYIAEYHRD